MKRAGHSPPRAVGTASAAWEAALPAWPTPIAPRSWVAAQGVPFGDVCQGESPVAGGSVVKDSPSEPDPGVLRVAGTPDPSLRPPSHGP